MTVRWSLRYTIFVLTGGMVLSLLGAALLVIGWHTGQATRQRLGSDLQRTHQQFEALRNAVGTYDPPTVFSALQSAQARTQSDFLLITDDQGVVLAATADTPSDTLATHPMIRQALHGEDTLHIWHRQDHLYRVVTMPLRTRPDLLGTLSIGYI